MQLGAVQLWVLIQQGAHAMDDGHVLLPLELEGCRAGVLRNRRGRTRRRLGYQDGHQQVLLVDAGHRRYALAYVDPDRVDAPCALVDFPRLLAVISVFPFFLACAAGRISKPLDPRPASWCNIWSMWSVSVSPLC